MPGTLGFEPVLELLPLQPTKLNIIAKRIIPSTIVCRRLRFGPAPASTRPNIPKQLKLARIMGETDLEPGRMGSAREAVAAAVPRVSVVDGYVPFDGLTGVGLKLQVVFVGSVLGQVKATVPV